MRLHLLAAIASAVSLCTGAAGARTQSLDASDFLPDGTPWQGRSRELIVPAEHPWVTPAERTGLTGTPTYDETVAWLRRLADASPDVDMVSIGRSAELRDIWMVVASRSPRKDAQALRESGNPLVLVQAGIHAGEIDGKDAGLMLLRDMTVGATRSSLLDHTSFLFVPILNPDGHERRSRYNRINQRGPVEMGWRTNARNLNLNRDYTKLESEEIRAVVATINRFQPDLYVDVHVTDGADYQYDVTWGSVPSFAWSGAIGRWLESVLDPAVAAALVRTGHEPGPLMWPANGTDFADGNAMWTGTPRFSHVYGAVRHMPSILVENHSLKPYDRRVLGTYVFLASVLEAVGRERIALRKAIESDRAARADEVVLAWDVDDPPHADSRVIKAIRSQRAASEISGDAVVRWTGQAVDSEIRFVSQDRAAKVATRPRAYYVPLAWAHIAAKLALHGIELERLERTAAVDVMLYRLPQARLAGTGRAFDERTPVYEGRMRIEPGTLVRERRTIELPAGSWRVDTDQPLGDLAVLLLEPESADSLFQWGYFAEILSRTEYAEPYIIEPMARAMLAADPELAREFEAELQNDTGFASSPDRRLDWFYRRTPYFDDRYGLYPIAREESAAAK